MEGIGWHAILGRVDRLLPLHHLCTGKIENSIIMVSKYTVTSAYPGDGRLKDALGRPFTALDIREAAVITECRRKLGHPVDVNHPPPLFKEKESNVLLHVSAPLDLAIQNLRTRVLEVEKGLAFTEPPSLPVVTPEHHGAAVVYAAPEAPKPDPLPCSRTPAVACRPRKHRHVGGRKPLEEKAPAARSREPESMDVDDVTEEMRRERMREAVEREKLFEVSIGATFHGLCPWTPCRTTFGRVTDAAPLVEYRCTAGCRLFWHWVCWHQNMDGVGSSLDVLQPKSECRTLACRGVVLFIRSFHPGNRRQRWRWIVPPTTKHNPRSSPSDSTSDRFTSGGAGAGLCLDSTTSDPTPAAPVMSTSTAPVSSSSASSTSTSSTSSLFASQIDTPPRLKSLDELAPMKAAPTTQAVAMTRGRRRRVRPSKLSLSVPELQSNFRDLDWLAIQTREARASRIRHPCPLPEEHMLTWRGLYVDRD